MLPVRVGLYVGAMTINPPNVPEIFSARDLRQPYDQRRERLIQWYEALGSKPEYPNKL